MFKNVRILSNGLFLMILLLFLLCTGCSQQAQTPSAGGVTSDSNPTDLNANQGATQISTYGSKTAALKSNWELTEMLQYAIEDEYMARAEYKYVLATFGDQNPFSNIVSAEETHINSLKSLYASRNLTVPPDNADQHLVKPATLKDSLSLGVDAEIANINMYKNFLDTPNLPDDVKTVFTQLKAGSENHLNAFQNRLSRF